jgi:hypothetical protein
METDYSNREECTAKVGATPHLQEQRFLVLLNLFSCRTADLVELGLELVLVDV